MTEDVKLAWLFTQGSDRREWWRFGLTALGAIAATGLAMAAVVIGSLRGQHSMSVAAGLLNQPGERTGAVMTLLLLLLAVLGFLGQCTRIGAVHRDKRLAGLRLAGASPSRTRRVAGLETGLACLLGSLVATAVVVPTVLSYGQPHVLAWPAMALVAVLVPGLGAACGVLALRRVIASPLGEVRRARPQGPGRGTVLTLLVAAVLIAGALALVSVPAQAHRDYAMTGPMLVLGLLVLVSVGTVWLSGVCARRMGRRMAARTDDPASLIAGERLVDDPWATARTHAAVMVLTAVATAYVGIRRTVLDVVALQESRYPGGYDMDFYRTGFALTAAAIVLGLLFVLASLAVGTAESVASRRDGLAAQVAAGVPRKVLAKALILETALPLAPAVLLTGILGTALGAWYAEAANAGVSAFPWAALPLPFVIYAVALLAAATGIPLLRRTVRPSELRHA
ncbi:FtsX-like permease family protein [Streptomyces sp. NPDC002734]|uniref:ABC transporter permease n=1 Tax=Streptomyces sp. NPDC002734 TaxID=3154426 RepID=UPI0033294D3F